MPQLRRPPTFFPRGAPADPGPGAFLFSVGFERGVGHGVFWRTDEKDYYAILQVDPRADAEGIEAAYRRLLHKYHPDDSGNLRAGRRMRDLNEAYEVLSDPKSRAAYDRRRWAGPRLLPPDWPPNWHELLKRCLPYLGIALLALLALRLLPLLLRLPLLIPLALAVLAYVIVLRFYRR